MITFNVDNLMLFYLTMAIVLLSFTLLVIFGKTEKRHRK